MIRILIISHLPIDKGTNVGKTLHNLFDNYPYECLSQLFFTPVGECTEKISSISITDKQVLSTIVKKNIFNLQRKSTNIIESIDGLTNKRSPSMLLARDFIWKIGEWNNADFVKWINQNKPQAIFLAPGYSMFPYDIAYKLARERNIPLFIYFMEDFYNEIRFSLSPVFWIRIFLFRHYVRKVVRASKQIFVLNEALKIAYEKDFKKPIDVIFNPTKMELNKNIKESVSFRLLYGGGINIDRFHVLREIGEEVIKLKKRGYLIDFFVYGNVRNLAILDGLAHSPGIYYGGILSENELNSEIRKSDVLVHVESFKKKFIAKTKRALSTKIPEYLASGRLILAIGPAGIEGIQYLERNEAAVIVTEMSELGSVLTKIITNQEFKINYICNALKLATLNHNKDDIQNLLYGKINRVFSVSGEEYIIPKEIDKCTRR